MGWGIGNLPLPKVLTWGTMVALSVSMHGGNLHGTEITGNPIHSKKWGSVSLHEIMQPDNE